VRAIDADARALLIGIAAQAGINMVVSSDVNRRVSLTLNDVPAIQAIQEIAVAANLTIATPENTALPAIVYYQLPVNVNTASAETIAKRFDVSLELARWIVEARKPISVSP
jgi:type II secretory pathway component HofQ